MRPGSLRWGRQAATVLMLLTLLVSCGAPLPTPSPRMGPLDLPETVGVLPVHTLAEAQSIRDQTATDELLAVAGWLNLSEADACEPEPARPQLEPGCGWDRLVLTDEAQDFGVSLLGSLEWGPGFAPTAEPELVVAQLAGATIEQYLPDSGVDRYRSQQAVVVGHFHDPRAADCRPEYAKQCASAFVADNLAWLEGELLGTGVWIGLDENAEPLKPSLAAEEVQAAVAEGIGGMAEIVSLAAVRADDLPDVDPRATQAGQGSELVWYVRLVTLAEADTAAQPASGWVVIDDASGRLLAAAGGLQDT